MDRLMRPPVIKRVGLTDFTGWLPIRLFVVDAALWVDWCYRGDTQLRAPFF